MANIYTRKGDNGMTSLGDGQWVAKASIVLELYGCIDELNAHVGWTIEAILTDSGSAELAIIVKRLYQIQRKLFALNQQITAKEDKFISEKDVAELEGVVDAISNKLPPLKSFVLPGGGEIASRLHIARTLCRRAERAAFRVVESKKSAEIVAVYLNRLSDWFFVSARLATFAANIEEITV